MWILLAAVLAAAQAGSLVVEVVPDVPIRPEARRKVIRPEPMLLSPLELQVDGVREATWDGVTTPPLLPFDDGPGLPEVSTAWAVTRDGLVIWADALPGRGWSWTLSVDPDGLRNAWWEVGLRGDNVTWTVCRSPEVDTHPLTLAATPCGVEEDVGVAVKGEHGWEIALPWWVLGAPMTTMKVGAEVRGPRKQGGAWSPNGRRQPFPASGTGLGVARTVQQSIPQVVFGAEGMVIRRGPRDARKRWSVERYRLNTRLDGRTVDFSEVARVVLPPAPTATRVVLRQVGIEGVAPGTVVQVPPAPELRNLTPVHGERISLAWVASAPVRLEVRLGEDSATVELPKGRGVLHIPVDPRGRVEFTVGERRFVSIAEGT